MSYAGETSLFSTELVMPEAGRYELEIVAADGENANFGRVIETIRVR